MPLVVRFFTMCLMCPHEPCSSQYMRVIHMDGWIRKTHNSSNRREGWKINANAGQRADGYHSNPESLRRSYVRPRQQTEHQEDGTNDNIDSDLEDEKIRIFKVKSAGEETAGRKIGASITAIRKQTMKKVLPTLGHLDVVDHEKGEQSLSMCSSDDSGELG